MYQIIIEPQFKKDYQIFKRTFPELVNDFNVTLHQLEQTGTVEDSYNPHELNNKGGNYNGNLEYHLSDGKVDVIVIYMPHKTNPRIRMVRIGDHNTLFHGSLK